MHPPFDVAVVGAGPAGSSTAISLARHGIAAVLLDRACFPRHKLCGDFLNPINWPLLDDLGVVDTLRECEPVRISRFAISTSDGRTAGGPLPGQHALHSGLGLRRSVFDNILVERARRAGVAVEEGCSVTAISREKSGWSINCRGPAGNQTRHARVLVAADGRNSRMARQLGLDIGQPRSGGSVGFQMQLNLASGLGDSVEIHQFSGGYAGLLRLDRETVNLAFSIRRSCLHDPTSFQKLRQRYLDGNPALRELLSSAEPCGALHSVWPVYFPARRRYGKGFLLVGDAAQVTEPITGEGVYFALRSGQLAAESIAAGLREAEAPAIELAQYETACRRAFNKRARLNACLRMLMNHRPLLSAMTSLLGRQDKLFSALVRQVCGAAPIGAPPHQRLA